VALQYGIKKFLNCTSFKSKREFIPDPPGFNNKAVLLVNNSNLEYLEYGGSEAGVGLVGLFYCFNTLWGK
jgi:hypothetical protein